MKKSSNASRICINTILAGSIFLMAVFQSTAFADADGASVQFKTTTVSTPRGTPVSAVICSQAITPAMISPLNDQWMMIVRSYDAQIVAGATYAYNDHGYAWYMSEGGQGELRIESPRPYLEDGSYRKINASDAVEGDKVVYGDGLHSAVVTDAPGWVVSKWGDGPLVKHRLHDMPAEFGPDLKLTFYRKVPFPAPPPNLRIVRIVQ